MTTNNTFLAGMSAADKAALLAQLQQEKQATKLAQREAYESLRDAFVNEVQQRVEAVTAMMAEFKTWLEAESDSFREVMANYGQLRSDAQASFTLVGNGFKIVVAANNIKAFDERAEIASTRLIDYLNRYMSSKEGGADDPMYKLAMQMLERGKHGAFEYKNISRLYKLEDYFDEEYRLIMELFRESHSEKSSTRNFYFYTRTPEGTWERIEPSFCRL